MSNLEDKLSASIQTPRRRAAGSAKTAPEAQAAARSENKPRSAATVSSRREPAALADLNAGGGREINPSRIWPD